MRGSLDDDDHDDHDDHDRDRDKPGREDERGRTSSRL
jgi:hypothetical protein